MTKAACFSATFIARARVWGGKFKAADLQVVRIASQTARSSGGQRCAVGISKLGNGWLYPFLAALILADWGLSGYRIIVLSSANAALMHCFYPIIKQRFHRPRPFSVDPKLPSLLATLDVHSFPSGHVMTLTSVLVPIVILWPATAILAVLLACCLAWARVATAHHFPSDVFAGAVLGVGVGYPISLCLISLW
jgi:undecaprenyl-diphosphatase